MYIPILGGVAVLLQISVLWIIRTEKKIRIKPQILFWMALSLSCVLLVPMVLVTALRVPIMALVLLLCHHPTYSSSSIVLFLIVLCWVLMYVIAAVWMGESMVGIPNYSTAILALVLVLLVLRRYFFIMERNVWQVSNLLPHSFIRPRQVQSRYHAVNIQQGVSTLYLVSASNFLLRYKMLVESKVNPRPCLCSSLCTYFDNLSS